MVIKQAQAVAPHLGRGEITGAMGALENLLQIVSPMIWAASYRFFLRADSRLALLAGPGGHFVLAAAVRAVSSAILATTPPSALFVDD